MGVGIFGVGVADLIFGPMVGLLEAWIGWPQAFVIAAPIYAIVSLLSCAWLLRSWDRWVLTKSGAKLTRKVERLRRRRALKRPIRWLTEGSFALFTLASAVIGAVASVTLVRLASNRNPGLLRIVAASIAAGIFFAALWASIGAGVDAVVH